MHALVYFYEVLFRIQRETRGAVGTEYAFIIVFIAIAAAIGMVVLGTALGDYFTIFGNALLGAGEAVNPS